MLHHTCQKAPRLLTRYLSLILHYKSSNSLWNTCLDTIGHLINPLLSYNGILPQLARKICNISVKKVDTTRNINTDRFFFLTTGRSNSPSSSSSIFVKIRGKFSSEE